MGDTITEHKKIETKIPLELTLQNLSYLILEQLQENNKTIISQIRDTIQSEISKAVLQIKQDLKSETDGLHKQNSQRKSELEKLTRKIEILKNEKIQNEITNLRNGTGETSKIYNTHYLLLFYYAYFIMRKRENFFFKRTENERDPELHIRIIEILRESLQIDILGYIEDTSRIGKYNSQKIDRWWLSYLVRG